MATDLSSDIYDISTYVEEVMDTFIDVPENTLMMGIFGYLSAMNSNMIQNAIIMASEYSNEAIPVKAKFERNIITHALALGINKIRATPAYMNVMMFIPEEYLLLNMKDNKFTLDKDISIRIDTYEYHLDYDMIITRNQLPTGEYVYTAIYDNDGRNQLSDITNPYLPPIGKIKITNMTVIAINCSIRQTTYTKISKKILVDNPLENKVLSFSFDNQLAYFNVEVKEGDETHYLEPIYDGLEDYSISKFCNYSHLDSNNIRLVFNRKSYEPRINCEVTINVYTTKGSECNFTYNEDIMMDLNSERFTYERLFMIIRPISDSVYGSDKKTVDELKVIIPKEALSRGSITTYTDLNNFFNSINDDSCKLYFLERVHNQLERLYYSYMLIKNNNNIIPTNTLNVELYRTQFDFINNENYILLPGADIYLSTSSSNAVVKRGSTEDQLIAMEDEGFLYMNPFLIIVNKSPFYVSYFLTIINSLKYIIFDYINHQSQLQFITSSVNCVRNYFEDKDTYKISLDILQNINNDFNLIELDDDGNVTNCKIKVIGVLYDDILGNPYRYCIADLKSYDLSEFIYGFEFSIKTNDVINVNNKIYINDGIYEVGTSDLKSTYFSSNVKMKIYILVESDDDLDRKGLDDIIPNLDKYTLCNTYEIDSGIDLFYNYSNIVSSYVKLVKNSDNSLSYVIHKMPLIKRSYISSEDRIQNFIQEVERRRSYIDYCITILEDSFGIDFKFFNTYGPSNLFNIDNETLLNKVNMTLTFELKLVTVTDKYITDYITKDIKIYLEDINSISDLHMPNLITYITTKYREQLVYFKFLDLNGYGPVKQSIYKVESDDDYKINNTVPEFLNVNTKDDNSPDINYIIIS